MDCSDKNLRDLTRHWYQKLKEEGFEDIEEPLREHSPLKSWHSLKWKNMSQEKLDETERYYFKARALLHSYPFQNEVHRMIWQLHAEGLSKRKIETLVSGFKNAPKRETIGTIIQSIAKTIKKSEPSKK